MSSKIHVDIIDEEMRYDDCFYVPVFSVINTEYHADKKSKYQLAQAAIFVMQGRE